MEQTMRRRGPRTLAIDIGGTSIKAGLLDGRARLLSGPLGVRTPRPASRRALLADIRALVAPLKPFQRVAVGFPGVIRRGVVRSAPNLAERSWMGCDLVVELESLLGRPTRVANDAVVQGLGAIQGRGIELMLTLGTGLGSSLFVDGIAAPLELGHHPWRHGKTYEESLGDDARRRLGTARWQRAVVAAVAQLRSTFEPDSTYLGGGNAARLSNPLPAGVHRVENVAGLLGGFHLWNRAHPRQRDP